MLYFERRKLLFRDPNYIGQVLPTPAPDILLHKLDTKWKEAEVRGSYILNELALKGHINKGRLSNIPHQAGTNRNENLLIHTSGDLQLP